MDMKEDGRIMLQMCSRIGTHDFDLLHNDFNELFWIYLARLNDLHM